MSFDDNDFDGRAKRFSNRADYTDAMRHTGGGSKHLPMSRSGLSNRLHYGFSKQSAGRELNFEGGEIYEDAEGGEYQIEELVPPELLRPAKHDPEDLAEVDRFNAVSGPDDPFQRVRDYEIDFKKVARLLDLPHWQARAFVYQCQGSGWITAAATQKSDGDRRLLWKAWKKVEEKLPELRARLLAAIEPRVREKLAILEGSKSEHASPAPSLRTMLPAKRRASFSSNFDYGSLSGFHIDNRSSLSAAPAGSELLLRGSIVVDGKVTPFLGSCKRR
jgi:hypothetical protein